MNDKRVLLLLIAIFVTANCFANEPKEIPGLKSIFDKFKVDGSILIYDQNASSYMGYNLGRCNIAFGPASTFKIPNTLIALENKIIDVDYVFKWDGKKQRLPQWEKDMNIAEAFKVSCVPIYQEIARRIGVEKMKYYVQLFNYGNMDINADNVDKFWLEGNSSITQYQQIYFLQNLYNLRLPVSEEAMKQVKKIMINEVGDGYVISAKTGWAVRQNESVTWFVGYVEANDNVYFFATNLAPNENTNMNNLNQIRMDLTKDVMRQLKFIK